MDVTERLRALAAKELSLDASKFDPQTPLSELHIDSLAFVEFLFKVEEEFGIAMPDTSVTGLRTLGDLERTVSELVSSAPQT